MLAEAHARGNARADAAQDTAGMAWLFAIVPAGLGPLLFVAAGAFGAPFLARLALRWRSDLPLDLPRQARIVGARKRRSIAAAAAPAVAVPVVELLVEPWRLVTLRDLVQGRPI
ncbi:hypothetical protein [Qipengyuania sediminis]|uniref:hypothetical protein n=1 Tax=Qipengyuania sediminis TaxID=1532023 RepID=UPI00105A6419|nr:hypothetical protein [Qipengyuania sediminis]